MSIEEFLQHMRDVKRDLQTDVELLAEKYEERLNGLCRQLIGDVQVDSKVPMERSR